MECAFFQGIHGLPVAIVIVAHLFPFPLGAIQNEKPVVEPVLLYQTDIQRRQDLPAVPTDVLEGNTDPTRTRSSQGSMRLLRTLIAAMKASYRTMKASWENSGC